MMSKSMWLALFCALLLVAVVTTMGGNGPGASSTKFQNIQLGDTAHPMETIYFAMSACCDTHKCCTQLLDCCPDYSAGIWSTTKKAAGALAIGDSIVIERNTGAKSEAAGLFPGFDFRRIKLTRIAPPQKSK